MVQELPQNTTLTGQWRRNCRKTQYWRDNGAGTATKHILRDIHYARRHDLVKDAIRYIANRYGITVTNEPTFYDYEGGQHNRPDLTFCVPYKRCYIATYITVVQPNPKPGVENIGAAAAHAAQEKIKKHTNAVSRRDHQFIPFASETTGDFDRDARNLIKELQMVMPFSRKIPFSRDMYGAVSTALAEYRAEVVINALTRARTMK